MESVVQIKDLTKTYRAGGKDVLALDKVSFEVPAGIIFGLLGPNGAGKTTTVKSACGLIKPDSGTVLINGKDVRRQRFAALSQIAAVLEGNRNIYWRLTPGENLEFFAALRGRKPRSVKKEIADLLELFGLAEKGKQPVRKLSRGMQQKLAIAVTLVTGAKILLLDEPTLGLDVQASYDIRNHLRTIVREEGRTVILTTHDMNVVEDICSHVVIINQGRVVTNDSTDNLLRLFKVRSYALEVGELIPEQREALARIPHLKLERINGNWRITLDMEKHELLWQVLDILRTRQTPIESIDRRELNFEKVFMEILGRERT